MNIFAQIIALFKVKDFIETEIKEAKQMNGISPGYKTTEFWFSLLSALGTAIAGLSGFIPGPLAAQLAAGISAVYAIGRSIVKAIGDVKSAGSPPAA